MDNRRNFFKVLGAGVACAALPATTTGPVTLTSVKPFDYSKIYMSKEALEDIKNWGVDKIDEETRKEILHSEYGGHIAPISVSADLSRENINELGKKSPYYRTVKFPIGV